MEMLLFLFLVLGRLLWRNDWSQNWKSVVFISCYCIGSCLRQVTGDSYEKVIAMRRRYCENCSHSFFIIIVLIIRILFFSVIFPCCCFCSG
jgi:hypothetical protein